MGARAHLFTFALLSGSLAGCGTVVPNIGEAWDEVKDIPDTIDKDGHLVMPRSATTQIEFEIKKQIYCELKAAVQTVEWYQKNTLNSYPLLPHDWGASVSLSLQVDEFTSLNPGVALNVPMANAVSTFGVVTKETPTPPMISTPQSFSLGFGANLSATATRIDKFDPYYSIKYLLAPDKGSNLAGPLCHYDDPTSDPITRDGHSPAKSSPLIPQDSPILQNTALHDHSPDWSTEPHIVSQLGLVNWLVGAVYTNQSIPSVTGPSQLLDLSDKLERERVALKKRKYADNKRKYSDDQITEIITSGASDDDVIELESREGRDRKYTPDEIAKYLLLGVAPSVLLQYKDAGYEHAEIDEMITHSKRKAAVPGGGGASSPSAGAAGPSGGGGGTVPDTLTIEIKFIIVSNGNVTPTWKLLRVSANTGSAPLFSLGRTRTHDVIITIGPDNLATANTHLASQIGNAVSNGNQAAPSSTQ